MKIPLNKSKFLSKTNSTVYLKSNTTKKLNYIKIMKRSDIPPRQDMNRELNKQVISPFVQDKLNTTQINNNRNIIPFLKKPNPEKENLNNKLNQTLNRDRRLLEFRFNKSKNDYQPLSMDRCFHYDSKYFENIYKNMKIRIVGNSIPRPIISNTYQRKYSNAETNNSLRNGFNFQTVNKKQIHTNNIIININSNTKNPNNFTIANRASNIRKIEKATMRSISSNKSKKDDKKLKESIINGKNSNNKKERNGYRSFYIKDDREKILAKLEIIKRKQAILLKY
jgi:hypothetical protein